MFGELREFVSQSISSISFHLTNDFNCGIILGPALSFSRRFD